MRAPTDIERKVLDALVQVARPHIREHFHPDSCIVSTRVAIEVLTYFGIRATPAPLTALVLNPVATEMIEGGKTVHEVGLAAQERSPEDPEGPWTIGLGFGTQKPGAWAGHLMAETTDFGALVDLSLDQAARPVKNLLLAPTWFPAVEPGWWENPKTGTLSFAESNGTVIHLSRRCPDPDGFRTSPNWVMKTRENKRLLRDMVGATIRDMKPLMD